MKLFFSRWAYYLSSIFTLLAGFQNWPLFFAILLKLPIRRPFIIKLRNGLRFKIRSAMDIWIIKETCLDRDYERIGIELQNGWTIIDIGAGLGDFSIYAADKSKQGKVYAFEPFPDSFKLLQENIELNGVQNVFPYQKALASKPGTLSLETGTGIAVMHSTAQTSDNDTRIQVPSVTLSQAFTENNLLHCDFLKIDCEGGEYDILMNGDKETLSKIKHICLEYHDGFTKHSHDDLVNFLQGNGFEVTTEPNPVHAITGILYARNNAP